VSDPSYPGSPDLADSVETVHDVELLDPRPVAIDEPAAVIDGEVVDDGDLDAPDDVLATDEVDTQDATAGDQHEDHAADQDNDQDASGDEPDAQSDSGANGTGVLVLETWQIQIPATGDATVDAALARLTDVEGLPPAQHADVYEAVHAGLHEALADLDRA
jgi:hypothetical protein